MPHNRDSQELGRKLLVLTFALGHACDNGKDDEITALFCERERVLLQLDRAEPNSDLLETLRQVQQAENLVLHNFQMHKAQAVRDLERSLQGRKVAGVYSHRANAQSFESLG